jgi:hypothetical protein
LSGRVCYLSSTDHGDRLATVRLVGARSDESWRAGGSSDPIALMADVAFAADWIRERISQGEGRQMELPLLCVDVEGANCSWLTAPSTDSAVVAAALAHATEGEGHRSGGAWASPTLAEASVEALAAEPGAARRRGAGSGELALRGVNRNGHAGPQRLAVLAIPDVSARLVIDALDDRGVIIDHVVSLWHALAAAWDPAARASGSPHGTEVVASSAPVTAIVLVDPAGRLVWAWSRGGELLSAGTIRLPHDRHETGTGMVRIGRTEVGRLTTDWLAWSVQLGAAPARVVCIAPATGVEDDPDDLTPAGIGSALGRAWPGATVDLAVQDDPIGATLGRLVDGSEPAADPRWELMLLTHRPGRAHRSLYRWAAACILAAAIGTGGIGWKAYSAASDANADAADARAKMTEVIGQAAPPATPMQMAELKAKPRSYIQDRLRARQQAANPGLEPPRPILAELETLSYVLGTRQVEIEDISLMPHGVTIYVRVPDTATAEMLKASLDSVAETHCEWRGDFHTGRATGAQAGRQTVYTLQGAWKTQDARRTAASGTPQPGGRP